MFDLGFWELLLIGVVALLVVGPERLPALASFVGQWVGRTRRFVNHMRHEIQQELETEHLKNLVEEQNRELQSLKREVADVRDETDAVTRETADVDRELRTQAAQQPASGSAQVTPGQAAPGAGGEPAREAAQQPAAKAGKKTAGKKATARKKGAKSAKKAAGRADAGDQRGEGERR